MRARLAFVALLLLGGCAGSEEVSVTNVLVPPAQQRADLIRARDLGIINDAELQRALARIGQ